MGETGRYFLGGFAIPVRLCVIRHDDMKNLMIIFTFLLLLPFSSFAFEYGTPENFLQKIKMGFDTGAQSVQLKSVTNFEWDTVCVFERADDSTPPDSVRNFIIKRNLNREDYWFDFSFKRMFLGEKYWNAYLFIKDGKAVKIFRTMSGIIINGKNYNVARVSLKNTNCTSDKSARLFLKNKDFSGTTVSLLAFGDMEE